MRDTTTSAIIMDFGIIGLPSLLPLFRGAVARTGGAGQIAGMTPNDRPANENGEPVQEPGLFSTRKRAIESTLSLLGLATGGGLIWTFAKPETLHTIGIGLVVIMVSAIVAAFYRLIVHGRA